MRLSLFFLMLILLPVSAVVHAWLFARNQLPVLLEEARVCLEKEGVIQPVVTLHCLDVDLAGEAPSPEARRRAVEAVARIGALRLKPGADRLHVNARVTASLQENRLHVSGWLPGEGDIAKLAAVLSELRPDLTVDTTALMHAPEIRWPPDFQPPLDAANAFLAPVVDTLHVPAELHASFQGDTLTLRGMLPAGGLKEEILSALSAGSAAAEIDPSGLKASPHVRPAPFAKEKLLAAFLVSFFTAPPPRRFDIHDQGTPRLEGTATRRLESEWLTLLRPVTGASRVDSRLVLLPSLYHIPDYKPRSMLPPALLAQLREVLQSLTISFEEGSSRIPAADQTRLAAVAPSLLAAGPALALVIGGHPDPLGDATREAALARARAEAVLSFLIEQGVPAHDISAVAFEPVSAGSTAAPVQPRSVEILIK